MAQGANVLSGRLKEVKTNLAEIGIIIDNEAAKDPNTRVKTISICKAKGKARTDSRQDKIQGSRVMMSGNNRSDRSNRSRRKSCSKH